jgi:predicted nucleic acid-binding protein
VIIADTNLIAYSLIEGPFTADALRVMRIDEEWLAPPLWQSELLSVLWLSVRTRVLSHARADEVYSEAEVLVHTAERPVPQHALALAVSSGCSTYDCEFVALAQATGVPLVTNDQKVLAAFPDVAVSLREFGG